MDGGHASGDGMSVTSSAINSTMVNDLAPQPTATARTVSAIRIRRAMPIRASAPKSVVASTIAHKHIVESCSSACAADGTVGENVAENGRVGSESAVKDHHENDDICSCDADDRIGRSGVIHMDGKVVFELSCLDRNRTYKPTRLRVHSPAPIRIDKDEGNAQQNDNSWAKCASLAQSLSSRCAEINAKLAPLQPILVEHASCAS